MPLRPDLCRKRNKAGEKSQEKLILCQVQKEHDATSFVTSTGSDICSPRAASSNWTVRMRKRAPRGTLSIKTSALSHPSIGPYTKNRIFVYSRSSTTSTRIVRVQVGFGNVNNTRLNGGINYQIGCAEFTLPTFTRILRNAGVKTTKKAFAAQAGA
jgi:hypothetical protein